jgi:hypothetical protein
MSMASEAAEERFRQAVYREAQRTGRPFSQIWIEMGGSDGTAGREVSRLTADISKAAGELLDERAKRLQLLTGKRDYRKAFDAAAEADPETARAYGLPDPDRPAQVPLYRQEPPQGRRRAL